MDLLVFNSVIIGLVDMMVLVLELLVLVLILELLLGIIIFWVRFGVRFLFIETHQNNTIWPAPLKVFRIDHYMIYRIVIWYLWAHFIVVGRERPWRWIQILIVWLPEWVCDSHFNIVWPVHNTEGGVFLLR